MIEYTIWMYRNGLGLRKYYAENNNNNASHFQFHQQAAMNETAELLDRVTKLIETMEADQLKR
jgi:pyrroloquinoline quinone (PQQ) biosynthesis protein C